jgi:hypothetical protein
MKMPRRLSMMVLILAAFLTACGGAEAPATSQVDVILTEGVRTLVASYFEKQTAMAPTVTPTVPATLTPVFTPVGILNATATQPATPTFIYWTATLGTPFTVTVTGTLPTATVDPSLLGYGCNNLAFIKDVNYPPGTVLQPGENFTKIWKVANTGTCNWMYVYRLAFLGGTNFDPPSINLGRVVTVNDWAEVSLNLDAPKHSGTYSAYWRMSDGDGHMFGATLGVTIEVKELKPPTETSGPPTGTSTATATPPTPTETSTP